MTRATKFPPQALGLPEPDVHWSKEVKGEGFSVFGDRDELLYFSDDAAEEEETRFGGFSSNGGVGTRVLPRAVAVERVNMARRRRLKGGIQIPETPSGESIRTFFFKPYLRIDYQDLSS